MITEKTILNILIGSTMQFLDKKTIVGEVSSASIVLYNILVKSALYAIKRYTEGDYSYYKKVKIIEEKINQLRYQCPDICNYKN